MNRALFPLALVLSCTAFAGGARGQDPVQLELLSDVSAISPGSTFKLGVRAKVDPGWHIYWRNPGEGGLPTEIGWTAPAGFEVGETSYPIPHKIVSGPEEFQSTSHALDGTVYFVTNVIAPTDVAEGGSVTIAVEVNWQACAETCLQPTTTPLQISLPVAAATSGSADAEALDDAWQKGDARAPRARAFSLVEEGQLEMQAVLPEEIAAKFADEAYFMAMDPALLHESGDQISALEDGKITFWAPLEDEEAPVPQPLEGLLVGADGAAIWLATAPPKADGAVDSAVDSPRPTGSEASGTAYPAPDSPEADEIRAAIKEIASWREPTKKKGLGLMLVFAFLGGMILNLMPCVFPVLGIKIMGFVQQAGSDTAKIRRHGLVFGAGVLISLWALVAVLFIIRAAGSSAGWGFQLQEPWFVVFMITVLFVFALNMAGLFEIGTSLTGVGSGLQSKHGYSGSFFSGVLAVLVATPCTGPFMAPALGFALSEPHIVGIAIFTALGVGLALPYVVLSFFPALIQKLPRPGAWMVTFKQFMSFPLFATVVWLVAVLGKTRGSSAVTIVLFGLIVVAFGFWIYGRYGTPVKKPRTRWIARGTLAAFLALFAMMGSKAIRETPGAVAHTGVEQRFGLQWESFDPRKIVEHRRAGRAMFIDFTASW